MLVLGVESVAAHELLLPHQLSWTHEASYGYTRGRFQTAFVSGFPQFGTVEVGDRLPYVPEHQGSLRSTLVHPRFSLSLAGFARTGMLDVAGPERQDIEDGGIPGLFLLDAAADVVLHERVSAYVTGRNLTGSTALVSWRPFGARPTAPLTVMVGIKSRLGRLDDEG